MVRAFPVIENNSNKGQKALMEEERASP